MWYKNTVEFKFDHVKFLCSSQRDAPEDMAQAAKENPHEERKVSNAKKKIIGNQKFRTMTLINVTLWSPLQGPSRVGAGAAEVTG